MKTRKVGILIAAVLLLALLGTTLAARAATGAFNLDWWVVAGGGGSGTGGAYTLSGTIGQAAPGTLQNGVYTLQGGFWYAGETPQTRVFIPFLRK
jgi:hypothetical protein